MKKILVKKRNGRIEPFDGRKMARAVSRAGVPYSIALEVTRTVKNISHLAGKEQVSSVTLRKMVSEELRNMNYGTMAKSYAGYKKSKSTGETFERSGKHAAKVSHSTKTHAKQKAENRHMQSGKSKLSRTSR